MNPIVPSILDEAVASRVFYILRDAQKETQNLLSAARHRSRDEEGFTLVERLTLIQQLVDQVVDMVQTLVEERITLVSCMPLSLMRIEDVIVSFSNELDKCIHDMNLRQCLFSLCR